MLVLRRVATGAVSGGRRDWISLGTSVASRKAAFANSSSAVRGSGSMEIGTLEDMVCCQRIFFVSYEHHSLLGMQFPYLFLVSFDHRFCMSVSKTS